MDFPSATYEIPKTEEGRYKIMWGNKLVWHFVAYENDDEIASLFERVHAKKVTKRINLKRTQVEGDALECLLKGSTVLEEIDSQD
jgi:hypothetical protein